MSSWIFFKVFADICLYFSFIAVFPQLFSGRFEFYLPALACAAGAMLANTMAKLKPTLQILGCLIPLCGLFLAQNVKELIILIIPIIYSIAVIAKQGYPEYYRYRAFYKKLIILWCCIISVFALISELLIVLDGLIFFDLTAFAVYGTLSLISGVLLLRSLRLGNLTSQSTNRRQLAFTAGAIGSFVFIGISAERILMKYGKSLVQYAISTLKTIIAIPFYILGLIIQSDDKPKKKYVEVSVSELTESTEETKETLLAEESVSEVATSVSQTTEDGFPWWIVIVIMTVLVIILIALFGLHQRHSRVLNTKEVTEKTGKSKKRRATQISNQNKIRRYYRDFLKYQKQRGMKLKTDQTSLDILENVPTHRCAQEAKALREIYISARYNDDSEITQQQLDNARNALNKIRKK